MKVGPRRIVCLTEEPTEVLYALGEQQRIVGISGFTVRPPQARREKPKPRTARLRILARTIFAVFSMVVLMVLNSFFIK